MSVNLVCRFFFHPRLVIVEIKLKYNSFVFLPELSFLFSQSYISSLKCLSSCKKSLSWRTHLRQLPLNEAEPLIWSFVRERRLKRLERESQTDSGLRTRSPILNCFVRSNHRLETHVSWQVSFQDCLDFSVLISSSSLFLIKKQPVNSGEQLGWLRTNKTKLNKQNSYSRSIFFLIRMIMRNNSLEI